MRFDIEVAQDDHDLPLRLMLTSRSFSARVSAWRPWMFCPTMMSRHEQHLDHVGQEQPESEAIGGSNCSKRAAPAGSAQPGRGPHEDHEENPVATAR